MDSIHVVDCLLELQITWCKNKGLFAKNKNEVYVKETLAKHYFLNISAMFIIMRSDASILLREN